MVLAQFGSLGLTNGNAVLTAAGTKRTVLVSASAWISFAVAALLATVGVGAAIGVPDVVQGVGPVELGLALATLPFMLLNLGLQGILLGEGRTITFNVVTLATAALPLVVLLAAIAVASIDPAVVLATGLLAHIAATLLCLVAIGTIRVPLSRPDAATARRLLGAGARLYAATLLAFLLIRIDVLLINAYKGPTQVGYYAVAVSFVDVLVMLPSVMWLGLFARVLRTSANELPMAPILAGALGFLPICALAAIAVLWVIELLYGPSFAPSRTLFLALVPGVYALGVTTVISQVYAARGRGFPVALLAAWVGALTLNIAMNITLLPHHGTVVASIASSVCYALALCVHVGVVWRDHRAAALAG